MSRRVIGVDWGTTNLRAFLFDGAGGVAETRRSAAGLSSVKDRAFEQTLLSVIGDWVQAGDAGIFISGMAGAREGWIEAPYAPCPADASSLSAAMVRPAATRLDVWIAPGIMHCGADGLYQIMRGEETQIFGAAPPDGLAILPGTHSKWARIGAGGILDFRSAMTGELYALLKSHSILGRLMQGDQHDEASFKLGVERALQSSAILSLLFSVRSEGLFGALAPTALPSYLSGLLIGTEIAQLRPPEAAAVTLIGAAEICALYHAALSLAGAGNVAILSGENAAARGLWRLAEAKAPA